MDKLTLEHLSPYLSYGLTLFSKVTKSTYELIGLSRYELMIADRDSFNGWYAINNFKPIFRPICDLTKEIEHDGKKFVPIIELYRNSYEYYVSSDLDHEFIDSWGAKGNILKVYKNRLKDEYTEFVYSNLSFRKDTRFEKGSYNFGMYLPHSIRVDDKIHNIYFLQKLLFKWHFDVFGIIEHGLAVDINQIDNFNLSNN